MPTRLIVDWKEISIVITASSYNYRRYILLCNITLHRIASCTKLVELDGWTGQGMSGGGEKETVGFLPIKAVTFWKRSNYLTTLTPRLPPRTAITISLSFPFVHILSGIWSYNHDCVNVDVSLRTCVNVRLQPDYGGNDRRNSNISCFWFRCLRMNYDRLYVASCDSWTEPSAGCACTSVV